MFPSEQAGDESAGNKREPFQLDAGDIFVWCFHNLRSSSNTARVKK
jgi:hypothetical protein